MKKIILFICIALPYAGLSQIVFSPERSVLEDILYLESFDAADFNGDEYNDIIAAYYDLSERYWVFAWFEYLENINNFSKANKLSVFTTMNTQVSAVNLDGDSDIDLVLFDGLYLHWYDNTDGNGTFSEPIYIGGNVTDCFAAADLDNDNDMDIVSGSVASLIWWKNDGNQNFTATEIYTDHWNVESLYITNLNNDNDPDILGTEGSTLKWFENTDGLGTFTTGDTITDGSLSHILKTFPVDIDGDNDNDILVASCADNKVVWFENTDGDGAFGSEILITDTLSGVQSVYASDLDNDLDNDLIVTANGKVVIYKNTDGSGNYSYESLLGEGSIGSSGDLITSDIRNDNDQDIIAGFYIDGIIWFENNPLPFIVNNITNTSFCEGFDYELNIQSLFSDSFQWQVNKDTGFENITDSNGGLYSGWTTEVLGFNTVTTGIDENEYRCILVNSIDTTISDTAQISISSPFIAADAGEDDFACNANYYQLSANPPEPGTGLWTALYPVGFEDPTIYNTTAYNLDGTTNELFWTITNGSCVDTDTVLIFTDTYFTITTEPVSLELNQGEDAVFTVETSMVPNTYQWYINEIELVDDAHVNGSTTSELTINDVTIADEGEYTCEIIGNCNSKISQPAILSVILNIENILDYHFSAYPNPSNGLININNNFSQSRFEITVYDIYGKSIFKKYFKNKEISLDLSIFPKGVYTLELISEEIIQIVKIILY